MLPNLFVEFIVFTYSGLLVLDFLNRGKACDFDKMDFIVQKIQCELCLKTRQFDYTFDYTQGTMWLKPPFHAIFYLSSLFDPPNAPP